MVVYPGVTTIVTAAGTFPQDYVTDGVLRFNVRVPIDRFETISMLGERYAGATWQAPAGLGLQLQHGHPARWCVHDGITFFIMALACSSRRVELRLRERATGIDRTFAGPWLRTGWTLSRPIRLDSGDSPQDISVCGVKPRRHNQGDPIAIDLSYLIVRKKS